MEPQLDFSAVLEEAENSLTEEDVEQLLTQLFHRNIVSTQLVESRFNWGVAASNKYLHRAKDFETLKILYSRGDVVWLDFFSGNEVKPNFDFESYFKHEKMIGKPSEPFEKAFLYLTKDGIEKRWKTLYRAYKSSRDGKFDTSASKFKRQLLIDHDRTREERNIDLDRVSKFAVLFVSDGSEASTTVDFVVDNLISKEDEEFLHSHGYIVRVGSSTHKIYPYGKPTKAKTSFHVTPMFLDECEDLLWNIFRKKALQEGIDRYITEIESSQDLKERYLSRWNQATKNGVQA